MRASPGKRAKAVGAALAALVVLGAALLIRRPTARAPTEKTTATQALPESLARPAAPALRSPEELADPEEALRHGSREPLIPPVIHLEATLAPGSVVTSEPLIPPVIELPAIELAPGSVATSEPLVPPVIEAPPRP